MVRLGGLVPVAAECECTAGETRMQPGFGQQIGEVVSDWPERHGGECTEWRHAFSVHPPCLRASVANSGRRRPTPANCVARPIHPYNILMFQIDSHPLLDLRAFVTAFPRPLGELPSPPGLLDLFSDGAVAPVSSDDSVREAVRALLRHGGFKPTGRSKPASEYLIKAAQEKRLSPINLAVDSCNVVS